MQTFLPHPNIRKSLKSLDSRRLGKQRVEAHQILNILLNRTKTKGWRNHPAVKMWKGHVNALNYNIPQIAKREKSPIEILNDRYARGEISDIEYQNKIRLMRLAKDHLKQDKKEEEIEIKIINKQNGEDQ